MRSDRLCGVNTVTGAADLGKIVKLLVSSYRAGDYEKANGVCILDSDSRYVMRNTSEYITTEAKSDNLISNSPLCFC